MSSQQRRGGPQPQQKPEDDLTRQALHCGNSELSIRGGQAIPHGAAAAAAVVSRASGALDPAVASSGARAACSSVSFGGTTPVSAWGGSDSGVGGGSRSISTNASRSTIGAATASETCAVLAPVAGKSAGMSTMSVPDGISADEGSVVESPYRDGPCTRMNLFTAVNAAMRTAMETDASAVR